MAFEVKLTRGNSSKSLTSGAYSVGSDFVPPAIEMSYNISSGTSANISSGGTLISSRANDRQFSFSVRILATSLSDAGAYARQLAAFIKAQSSDALYLEYRENSSIPIPSWGQFGAPLRYEIITADVSSPTQQYLPTSGKGFFVTITLEIKPFAVGIQQQAINASGGIFENNYGSIDGTAKGLSIFEATTNKMTNPVFGASTWNTNWTTGIGAITVQNTDTAFCLPCLASSAKVTGIDTTNNSFYMSIAAGNTNKHSFTALIMLPDLSTPSSANMVLFYDATSGGTFQSLGNGLWLVYWDNVTGIAAAKNVGVLVTKGHTIYVLGFQMEEKAYHTPLAYGDLLGCAWTGTAHASTSTRTASILRAIRTDQHMSLAQGAVSMVWKPYYANTFGAVEYLFVTSKSDFSLNGIHAYFDNADDKIYFKDGTNTISTAAQTFSAGDILNLTFTWGPGGLNIYKSGVNAATGATYTPAIVANQYYLDVGCFNTGGECNGNLLGFDIYPTELTAAQALAIYTAQSSIVTGGGRPSLIPWLYTSTGTGLVYNHDDSGHDNWLVVGGIAGSAEAKTVFAISPSAYATKSGYYFGGYSIDSFVPTANQWWFDRSGTADATSSGGEYFSDGGPYSTVMPITKPSIMFDKLNFLVRARHSSATLGANTLFGVKIGSMLLMLPNVVKVLDTTFRTMYFGTLDISGVNSLDKDNEYPQISSMGIEFDVAAGGFYWDWIFALPGKMMITGSDHLATKMIISKAGIMGLDTSGIRANNINYVGDVPDINPGQLNILWFITGLEIVDANVITDTATFEIIITPRYTLT